MPASSGDERLKPLHVTRRAAVRQVARQLARRLLPLLKFTQRTRRLYQSSPLPSFALNYTFHEALPTTVMQLRGEFFAGIRDKPAIRDLESSYGNAWRSASVRPNGNSGKLNAMPTKRKAPQARIQRFR